MEVRRFHNSVLAHRSPAKVHVESLEEVTGGVFVANASTVFIAAADGILAIVPFMPFQLSPPSIYIMYTSKLK